MVDEIVQEATGAACDLLVPEGLSRDTWAALTGLERFYLRMLDIESAGVHTLDNYQNFSKAFGVPDYQDYMASATATKAFLKQPESFSASEMGEGKNFYPTRLTAVIRAVHGLLTEVESDAVIRDLVEERSDYLAVREQLADLAGYLAAKCSSPDTREKAEVLAARIKNSRFGD
ncbi:hypothetical protein ACE0DR_27865 [Azotobacter sp. CWF10]